jgi:ubiquinone/menaquinone biosynthesis C-methylase UbiE
MSDSELKEHDFEHPSILFILEDKLKVLIGGPLFYNPYYRTFGLKGNENVLDFGCGGGVGSRCLANLIKKGHLTCVDISQYWIEKARKRVKKYSNVECKAGDIREIDIPDSTFDVISTIHVIHDIHPKDRQSTVGALTRKLKPGGILFIKERIEKSHGMPVEEIRSSFFSAGLKEIEHKETKSEYLGKYLKVS